MEFSVLIQRISSNGYRASCGAPLFAMAEGVTRDEALAKLRAELETRLKDAEVVRLTIHPKLPISKEPVWLNDDITRDWLEGIAAVRAATDAAPDPRDLPSDTHAS
jgi:predicted RNase H-like HicB family nuclease